VAPFFGPPCIWHPWIFGNSKHPMSLPCVMSQHLTLTHPPTSHIVTLVQTPPPFTCDIIHGLPHGHASTVLTLLCQLCQLADRAGCSRRRGLRSCIWRCVQRAVSSHTRAQTLNGCEWRNSGRCKNLLQQFTLRTLIVECANRVVDTHYLHPIQHPTS